MTKRGFPVNLTEFRQTSSEKAEASIFTILAGTTTSLRGQFENAFLQMDCNCDSTAKVIWRKLQQPRKAFTSMRVSDAGKAAFAREIHPSKAETPICTVPSSKLRSVSPAQSKNASPPISRTLPGILIRFGHPKQQNTF
jgi:hypothetical protein